MSLPPRPKLPRTVTTFAYMARPLEFLERCHARYGDTFCVDTHMFGVEVMVVHPDAIKQVFTGDPDTLRAGEANTALGPLIGKRSVLLLDGKEHLREHH